MLRDIDINVFVSMCTSFYIGMCIIYVHQCVVYQYVCQYVFEQYSLGDKTDKEVH